MFDPEPVLRIRIDYNADPDTGTAFHLNPGQAMPSQKIGFWHEKFTLCRYGGM